MRNAILLLPEYALAIGLDPATQRETNELAYDLSQYKQVITVPTVGAFVWEGNVRCEHARSRVTYPGRVRPATMDDFNRLGGRSC